VMFALEKVTRCVAAAAAAATNSKAEGGAGECRDITHRDS